MPTIINGTTGINLLQSGVVTQANLAANVVGTGILCSMRMGNSKAVTAQTFTRVDYNVVVSDTSGSFNTTTFVFQPTIAGWYQVNANVYYQNSSATVLAAVYKNGASYRRGSQAGSAVGSGWGAMVSTLVYLNGSIDYIDIRGYSDGANTLQAGTDLNWFDAYLVKAA